MKRTNYLLFLVIVLAARHAGAAVLTVDNNANSAGQYTSLQGACAAANAGDTIYVSGSLTQYGTTSINKKLILIGTGYNPATQMAMVAQVSSVTLDTVNSISGASGTQIFGMYISYLTDNYGAKDILYARNSSSGISLATNSSRWVIQHNIFSSSISINNATNILLQNNILVGCALYTSNQNSVTISHNDFMYTIGSGQYCFNNIQYATVLNNIFWSYSPLNSNTLNCVFNNNVTYQTIADGIPGSGNSGSGNLVGINPQFVNVPTPVLNYAYNYNVANASPAHNGGTDGTDIGIYGGASPLPDLTGMPAIPQMLQMNIANPVIAPGASLNVDFKARKN